MTDLADAIARLDRLQDARRPKHPIERADPRDGSVYHADDATTLAVKVALVTNRPLLLRGHPGSGKSSLAAYIARNLRWRYYEHVVDSDTTAADLQWRFDTVRRFADAQMGKDLSAFKYVEPGVLWWALDPTSARRRGAPDDIEVTVPVDRFADDNRRRSRQHAVILIDEIDKADPDVPNGLLVPLGSYRITVTETGTVVGDANGDADGVRHRLVLITTNEERELPPAFLRRCVVHRLRPHDRPALVKIAEKHLRRHGRDPTGTALDVASRLASRLVELREAAETLGRRPPSTGEYLDAVFAVLELGIEPSEAVDADWSFVEGLTLQKPDPDDALRTW